MENKQPRAAQGMKATQIQPIEEIVPAEWVAKLRQLRTAQLAEQTQTRTRWQEIEARLAPLLTAARSIRASRRALITLAAATSALALALWPAHTIPQADTAPIKESASAGATAAPQANQFNIPEPDLAADHPQPTAAPSSTPPRAAIDALIAGDFERAQTLYQNLARAQPENGAYKHAALILQQRAQPSDR